MMCVSYEKFRTVRVHLSLFTSSFIYSFYLSFRFIFYFLFFFTLFSLLNLNNNENIINSGWCQAEGVKIKKPTVVCLFVYTTRYYWVLRVSVCLSVCCV